MNSHKLLDIKSLLMLCISLFILVAPTETAMKSERFYYVICGSIILICWMSICFRFRLDYSISIICYLLYSLLSCIWTPNNDVARYILVKMMTISFLYISIQFDYTMVEYQWIKRLLIMQQFVLLAMFLVYGRIDWDGRLWIGSGGVSTDPNSYTMWTILPLCLLIEDITAQGTSVFRRIINSCCLAAVIYIVMMSGSRSGIITNLFAGSWTLLYRFKEEIKKSPARSLMLLVLIIALAVIIYWNIPEVVIRRFASGSTVQLGGRTATWSTFLRTLFDHPLGCVFGLGEYSTVCYSRSGAVAHSIVIEILFNQGIIGLALVLLYMVKAFRRLWERDKYAAIGYLCTAVMASTLSEFSSRPVMTILFIGGMIVVGSTHTEDDNLIIA